MEYKYFKARHPDYDANYWAKCRAFYSGGKTLLGDLRLMKKVFPRHLVEEDFVYEERMKRAFYIPYAGEIIDAIVAALFGEEVKVRFDPEGVDPFYDKFFDDTSPPAGRKTSMNDLLKQQLLTALICKRSWTLVDLPDAPADYEEPGSLAEEEKAGLLDAYACPIAPEMVLDWEESEDGELIWAMIMHRESRRNSIDSLREFVREEYTVYTAEKWERYVVTYKIGDEPKDNLEVPMESEGTLSFGRVPLVRLEMTDGMWAMGKILPISIAHFNLRNALNWAECKSLFPVPIVNLGEEELNNPITADQDRATNQAYGQGRIVTLGSKDVFQYVGPDTSPFKISMEDLSNLRDEMHRVLHHMALSVDNSAAALQRSADSKQVDQAATAVILRALGQFVREHAVEIYEYVAAGRNEKNVNAIAEGMERFNEQSVESLVDQAEKVETLRIPSATFNKRWDYRIARRLLGDDATDEDLEDIKQELDDNISNEDFLPEVDMTNAVIPDEDDDDDESNGKATGFNSRRTANPL